MFLTNMLMVIFKSLIIFKLALNFLRGFGTIKRRNKEKRVEMSCRQFVDKKKLVISKIVSYPNYFLKII